MKYKIEIVVKRKEGVADPEGNTIYEALARLGYQDVDSVRVAKLFFIKVESNNPENAKLLSKEIAEKVLTNPVIEKFEILDMDEII